MNVLLNSPWTERIGWALLHSLWQGALIWSFAALLFSVGRNLSAARRHWVGCVSITLLAICPLVTITWLACKSGPQKAEAQVVSAPPLAASALAHEVEKGNPASIPAPVSSQEVVERYDRAFNAPPPFSLRTIFPFLVIGRM